MRYKTLFRIGQKLVGLWLLASGLGTFVGSVVQTLVVMIFDPDTRLDSVSYLIYGVLPSLFEIPLGAYLFFSGRWIADLAIPGNRLYCHECGYDLFATPDGRCPECGTPLSQEQREALLKQSH